MRFFSLKNLVISNDFSTYGSTLPKKSQRKNLTVSTLITRKKMSSKAAMRATKTFLQQMVGGMNVAEFGADKGDECPYQRDWKRGTERVS